ncbi:MAG TPA: serine/threonine-protein kinase [Anaeromyxobacter sp.]|nr:serine/threonine-protein kinase [Anaeromyxobacter sp.]
MTEPAQPPPPFEPLSLLGTTLDGRYDLVAHLATGGMGAVFRARHVHLRKDIAVKVLRPDLTSSAEIVERFRREAEIASALEHQNIVRVTDFGRSPEGYLFLVMELLTGESLFDRLRREGFLPPEEAVPILWQVCAGLEAAHALGVVHRDLKPENVFLARTGSGREITKILDFGIAKIADPTSMSATQSGIVVGTPEYLSPEQAMGTAIDARADLYAVGLIAWRTLAGRHPFKADEPRALLMMQATRPVPPLVESRPDLSAYPALVAAVARACAKEPRDRHQTAAALKDDLAAALGPAFTIPAPATPTPSSPALSPLPAQYLDLRPGRPATSWPARVTVEVPPALPATPAAQRARLWTRTRLSATRLGRRVRDAALATVGAHPIATVLSGVAMLGTAITIALFAREHGRAGAEARALLRASRPADALAVVDAELERRDGDGELLVLRGRALFRIPGRATEGVEAYAAALAAGGLDDPARDDLVGALGKERSVADRAARVLAEDGPAALPAVLRAASGAAGAHRLRALAVARDLGAEDRVNRAEAYGGLLSDGDCEVRRAAARRLGEIGEATAIPALRRAAQAKVETKGFFGRVKTTPACGAAEADAAARRIEAARLPQPAAQAAP